MDIQKQIKESRRYDAFGKPDDSKGFVLIDAEWLEKLWAVYLAATPIGHFGVNAGFSKFCHLQEMLAAVKEQP